MLNILNCADVVRIGLHQLLVSGIEKCKKLQKSLLGILTFECIFAILKEKTVNSCKNLF